MAGLGGSLGRANTRAALWASQSPPGGGADCGSDLRGRSGPTGPAAGRAAAAHTSARRKGGSGAHGGTAAAAADSSGWAQHCATVIRAAAAASRPAPNPVISRLARAAPPSRLGQRQVGTPRSSGAWAGRSNSGSPGLTLTLWQTCATPLRKSPPLSRRLLLRKSPPLSRLVQGSCK